MISGEMVEREVKGDKAATLLEDGFVLRSPDLHQALILAERRPHA